MKFLSQCIALSVPASNSMQVMAGFVAVFSFLKKPVQLVARIGRKTRKDGSALDNDMWAIE